MTFPTHVTATSFLLKNAQLLFMSIQEDILDPFAGGQGLAQRAFVGIPPPCHFFHQRFVSQEKRLELTPPS